MPNIAQGLVDPYQATTPKTTHTTAGGTSQATGSNFYWLVCWGSGASFTSFVDSKGNTPVLQGTEQTFASISTKARLYKAENGAGGAGHTSTLVITVVEFAMIILVEIVNGGATDIVTAWNDDVATPFTSPLSGTLAQAIEGLLAFCITGTNSGTETLTWGNGFASIAGLGNSAFNTGGAGFQRVTANTSIQSSFTSAGSGTTEAVSILVTIKEAGSGGVITTTTKEDDLVVSDGFLKALLKQNRIITDTVSVNDANLQSATQIFIVDEPLTLIDSTIRMLRLRRLLEDDLAINDGTVSVKIGNKKITEDDLTISDGPVTYIRKRIQAEDDLTVADQALYWRRVKRLAEDDQVIFEEFIKVVISGAGGNLFTKIMTELLVLIDDPGNRVLQRRVLASDVATVIDGVLQAAIRPRLVSDPLALVDAVLTTIVSSGIKKEDDLTLFDGFIAIRKSVRVLSDLLSVPDNTISVFVPGSAGQYYGVPVLSAAFDIRLGGS